MAWTLSLQNDDTTINLNDGTTYTALRPFLAPVPGRRTSLGGVNTSRHGADITSRVYQNRRVSFNILISGTTQDNLIDNINAIHNLLERAADYSVTGLGSQVILRRKWEGATNQIDFNVIDGRLNIGDEFSVTHAINTKINASIDLTCEPFALGAEETIQNYVKDAGFELAGTALSDWTENKTGNGTTARDTSVKKDGKASLKLTMTSSDDDEVIERSQVLLDVDAGEVWSFQCWVRVDALSNCKVVLEALYNAGSPASAETTTVNASEFVKLTINNATVPGSVTQVTLKVRLEATDDSATGTVYIDNVIAVLASAVPTAWASYYILANHQADDSQATSNYIDIEDVGGDVPAQLQLRVQENANHDEFWSGARHGSQQYDDVYIEAEASTSSAYLLSTGSMSVSADVGDVSDAIYSDGTALKSRATSTGGDFGGTLQAVCRLDYAITTLPKGTFRVLVSVRMHEDSGSGNSHNAAQWGMGMGWQYGDVSLLSTTAPNTSSFVQMPTQTVAAGAYSNPELLDLGTLTIPPIDTPDNMTDGTFTLNIYQTWDTTPAGVSYNVISSGQRIDWEFDYIHLMPVDRGSNYTSKTDATDYILLDSMSDVKALYLVNASDVIQSFPSGQLGRSAEVHPDGTRIYMLAKGAATLTKGDLFTTRVRYRPRFLQVMGA